MGNAVILCMNIVIIIYSFKFIFDHRIFLSHYLTSTGGSKPKVYKIKPFVSIIFILIHFIIGTAVGIFVFRNEIDKGNLVRFLVSINAGLFVIAVLCAVYFIVAIGMKEIISMGDKIIINILIYSTIVFLILFYQIYNGSIEYPEAFVSSSLILYIINALSIGRIVTIILKKKVSIKSIWCIAIINISFVIVSLTNITFQIQNIVGSDCYSRELISWSDALYFVLITFFTVGYGDLYPICDLSKALSIVIIITGFIFSTIFVSAGLSVTIEHFSNVSKNQV